MSDNSNNVHFSGVRLICSPYLPARSALAIQAANESYARKNEYYCHIFMPRYVDAVTVRDDQSMLQLFSMLGLP